MLPLARFRQILRQPVVADLAITIGGRWAQMLIALAGNVISARALGPGDFGRFGLVMALVTIGGTLADAGLTYTAVRFIAQYSAPNPARAHAVARAYWALRLGSGAVVALVGIVGAAPLAGSLLGYPDLTPYLQLSFCTLFSLSISSYPGTVLIALTRFGRLGVAGVINAAITLAGIVTLLLIGRLDLGTLIAWNVVLPVVSTLPTWGLLPAEWRPWRKPSATLPAAGPDVVRELLQFSRWMLATNLGSIIAGQADLLLLGRLTTPATVGVYSVALTLALRLDTLNQSLFTVLMPRASRLAGSAAIRQYSRRVLAGTLALATALGAVALGITFLLPLIYGDQYRESAGLFTALIGIVLFDLVTASLFLLAFPLNRPQVLAVAEWLRVAVIGLAGLLLIPPFGAWGAVGARFLSRILGTIYTLGALRRALHRAEESPAPGELVAADAVQEPGGLL